jgi:hypothetical protein
MRIIHNDKKSFLQKLYVYITYKEGIHEGLIAVVVVVVVVDSDDICNHNALYVFKAHNVLIF